MADVPASTVLDDLIEPFKREVAVPGTFAASYPTMTDSLITDYLADAFGEAQLDGWFSTNVYDSLAQAVTPGLSTPAQSLVVIYAGMRLLRTQMRNATSSVRYKAGSVEYETQTGATVSTQILKDLTARRDALITLARSGSRASYVNDNFTGRLYTMPPGRFLVWEIPLAPALAYGY